MTNKMTETFSAGLEDLLIQFAEDLATLMNDCIVNPDDGYKLENIALAETKAVILEVGRRIENSMGDFV